MHRAMETPGMEGFTPSYIELLLNDEYHRNNYNASDESEDEDD